MPCRVHAIHIQYCWWPGTQHIRSSNTQFSSNCHFYILSAIGYENSPCDWEHFERNFVKFFWAVLKLCPTKICATFLDHPIYYLQNGQSYKKPSNLGVSEFIMSQDLFTWAYCTIFVQFNTHWDIIRAVSFPFWGTKILCLGIFRHPFLKRFWKLISISFLLTWCTTDIHQLKA